MSNNESPTGMSDLSDSGNTASTAAVPSKQADGRMERGRALARIGKIESLGKVWLVHSQSSGARYVVNLQDRTCTCPDHEERGVKCKHQFAVEYTVKQETFSFASDGETVEATRTETKIRVKYTQAWSKYNAAQCAEKATVQSLLRSLCEGVVTPPHRGRGPKPIALADAVYAMTMKVYATVSARRATGEIEACERAGLVDRAASYNAMIDYFNKPEMTPLLTALVEDSASPLASIESDFAIDSTGFSTSVYRRWYDAKYGREMRESTWVKAHAIVGVKTNVITAIRVTDGNANDSPELASLVTATDRHFTMKQLSGDKAYLSHDNLATIESVGAVPYVPFKVNSHSDGSAAWRRMWGLFMYEQAKFLAAYHKRSNVESTFSAIKRLLGGAVRSKRFVAQRNEVLCKALAYNLTVLVHAMHELGVAPSFNGAQAQAGA